MCRVGFGVAAKAALRVSSCFALIVVRGPRRLPADMKEVSILTNRIWYVGVATCSGRPKENNAVMNAKMNKRMSKSTSV